MAAGRWCSVPIYRVPDSPGPIDKYYMEEELEAAWHAGCDRGEHNHDSMELTAAT
jgi:hypothetical protein